jgi:ribonuclease III
MDQVQKHLGKSFKNKNLLSLALTHRSYVHENKLPVEQSNERLEFLGDAVLGVCIAEMLINHFPQEPEGALSKRRAALVNQKQLFKLAKSLEIGEALLLGKGEEKTGGRDKASLLGDAFEAVIGALYLDQGMKPVQDFLKKLFADLIPVSKKVETSQDYKTRLQEIYQRKFKRSPRYSVIRETGPDHSKTFEVKVEFSGKKLAQGEGHSKRDAEQDAARNAFHSMSPADLLPPPRRKKKKKTSDRARADKSKTEKVKKIEPATSKKSEQTEKSKSTKVSS